MRVFLQLLLDVEVTSLSEAARLETVSVVFLVLILFRSAKTKNFSNPFLHSPARARKESKRVQPCLSMTR